MAKAVIQILPDGTEKEWPTVKNASLHAKISVAELTRCIITKNEDKFGNKFRYADSNPIKNDAPDINYFKTYVSEKLREFYRGTHQKGAERNEYILDAFTADQTKEIVREISERYGKEGWSAEALGYDKERSESYRILCKKAIVCQAAEPEPIPLEPKLIKVSEQEGPHPEPSQDDLLIEPITVEFTDLFGDRPGGKNGKPNESEEDYAEAKARNEVSLRLKMQLDDDIQKAKERIRIANIEIDECERLLTVIKNA